MPSRLSSSRLGLSYSGSDVQRLLGKPFLPGKLFELLMTKSSHLIIAFDLFRMIRFCTCRSDGIGVAAESYEYTGQSARWAI